MDALLDTFTASLREELAYRLELLEACADEDGEVFERNERSLYQAMQDAENFMDEHRKEWKASDRAMIEEMHRWQVARGVYRAYSDAELDQIVTMGGRGRKKYDFILDGQKYRFEQHL